MSRISAFGDDALGDHDAVGLVDELRAGRVSAAELVEAAIARAAAVNPTLNGLAFEAFDRARSRVAAPSRYGGYFDGVPSFIKDNVAVEGMPTMQGTDAWEPRPQRADGDFARTYLATGLVPLGKTQLSEFGFSASAEHVRLGPVRNPWNPRLHGRRVVGGLGCLRRGRGGAHRARQRRWRFDPDSGRLQRIGGAQTVPRPVAPGRRVPADAVADRLRRRRNALGA
jgi:hypothetical protein